MLRRNGDAHHGNDVSIRLNQKIENMLKDTDWNSNLDQPDADRLHDWALSTLAAHSMVATTMTSLDGCDYLEEKVTHVQNVLAMVNEVIGKRSATAKAISSASSTSERELRFNFHIILSNMRLLTNKRTNPYQVKRAIRLAKEFAVLSIDQLFAEIFALVENTRDITFSAEV